MVLQEKSTKSYVNFLTVQHKIADWAEQFSIKLQRIGYFFHNNEGYAILLYRKKGSGMKTEQLLQKIELQPQVRDFVSEFYGRYEFKQAEPYISGLTSLKTAEKTRKKLLEIFGADEGKLKLLTCMLVCAAKLYAWYENMGISETVYVDTMKCFPRFLEECYQMTGVYAFDREGWTVRQVGGLLFRIGTLEYELLEIESGKQISVHIPSDADLSEKACDESLTLAKKFFEEHFPEYAEADYVCRSWLLAPELSKLLPAESKIMKFQSRFLITETDYEEAEYIGWVFRTKETDVAKFKEDTTLQKNMKRWLLGGGKIGSGSGRLK